MKLLVLPMPDIHGQPFNWTKVELKQGCFSKSISERGPFNWTKVELKQ